MLGIPLSLKEAWQHFPGTSLAECMTYVKDKYDITFAEDFVSQYRENLSQVFARELTLIPGVAKCLERLTAYPKCVASNGPEHTIHENLKTTGIYDHFQQAIFSAYTIESWKPSPDLFLHAASAMNRDPNECIVIEDSEAGIQAGLAAGMKVLVFAPPSHQYQVNNRDTTLAFSDMSELPQILNKI